MTDRPAPDFLVTTSTSIDGYRVTRTIGIVRGIVVRSRGIVGNIGVKLQQIVGGNITLLTELCERSRQDAFAIAIDHARSLGANGIIAMRYDATEVMPGATEVLCYGTAVRIVEDREPRDV